MMLKLEYSLVKPTDPILRQKTNLIKKPTLETVMAYQSMVDLLKKNRFKWLALAAPQVGCPQAFFVSDFLLNRSGEYECFINPIITRKTDSVSVEEELCVSLPKTKVNVPRSKKVTIEYTTLTGGKNILPLEGMQARVAQHEIDHLNGKLITDYVEMPSNELGS
jgi:peptide deformylase